MTPAVEAMERTTQAILDGIARRLLDEREAQNDPTNRSSAAGQQRSIEAANCGGRDARPA